jgi:hypothetical protein
MLAIHYNIYYPITIITPPHGFLLINVKFFFKQLQLQPTVSRKATITLTYNCYATVRMDVHCLALHQQGANSQQASFAIMKLKSVGMYNEMNLHFYSIIILY